jgi:hypothetical protein
LANTTRLLAKTRIQRLIPGADAAVQRFLAKTAPTQTREVTAALKQIGAIRYLGLRLSTALSISMDNVNSWVEIGTRWTGKGTLDFWQALAGGKDSPLWKTFEQSGLPALARNRTTLAEAGWQDVRKRYGDAMLVLCKAADFQTKGISFFGARAKWLAEHPGDLAGATRAGVDLAIKTQVIPLRSLMPQIYQTAVGKLGFMFVAPMMKQASFQYGVLKEGDLAKLGRAIGALSALGIASYNSAPYARQALANWSPVTLGKKGLIGIKKGVKLSLGYLSPSLSPAGRAATAAALSGEPGMASRLVQGARGGLVPIPEIVTRQFERKRYQGLTRGQELMARLGIR